MSSIKGLCPSICPHVSDIDAVYILIVLLHEELKIVLRKHSTVLEYMLPGRPLGAVAFRATWDDKY